MLLATKTNRMSGLALRSAIAPSNSGSSALHGAHQVAKKSTTRILPGSTEMGTDPLLTGCKENAGAGTLLKWSASDATSFGRYEAQYHADMAIKGTASPKPASQFFARPALASSRPI